MGGPHPAPDGCVIEAEANLLTDLNKRSVVAFPRQFGKTTTLAVRIIHSALTKPKKSAVVAPDLRSANSNLVIHQVRGGVAKTATKAD